MKQFAVIGNPIAHSKSPDIHAAFAAQFEIQLNYERLLAKEGKFASTASRFFEYGIGANVTIPFKEAALQFADECSEAANLAGAVNTLSRQGDVIKGDNTDGIGLVRDIRDNHNVSFNNQNILIIGAGGASRGVILPIAKEAPLRITIVNRTLVKAQALSRQFAPYADIQASAFDELSQPFDIIINATSASLNGEALNLPNNIFDIETLAYDMMYGGKPTPFMQFAVESGAMAVNGLGMLVEQAAQSFEVWHGVAPTTQPVINMLRNKLVRELR